MKVLVLSVEGAPTDPKVFKDLPAFEAYLCAEKIDENYEPEEYALMVSRLEKGESWADHGSWIGWVEVQG